jgi:hypothetical protein
VASVVIDSSKTLPEANVTINLDTTNKLTSTDVARNMSKTTIAVEGNVLPQTESLVNADNLYLLNGSPLLKLKSRNTGGSLTHMNKHNFEHLVRKMSAFK